MGLCQIASKVSVTAAITAATIIATPVSAITRFVDASTTVAQPPTGTLGWGNPYKYLSDALSAAATGDEIWIKGNSTHYPDRSAANPSGTGDVTASFVIPDPIRLIGGFAGTELEEEERGNPFLRPTVLSGDLAGNDNYTATGFLADPPDYSSMSENTRHIVLVDNPAINAQNSLCEGLIVRGGHAQVITGVPESEWGAGMLCMNGAPRVNQCRFEFNRSLGDTSFRPGAGAGLFSNLGDLTVEHSEFVNNHITYGYGGGLAKNADNLLVSMCRFEGNRCSGSQGRGGGLFAGLAVDDVRLVGCRFDGNTAGFRGGGVALQRWEDASPTTGVGCGGAFECVNPAVIANSTFIANESGDDAVISGEPAAGGGVHTGRACQFDHCTFTQNTSARGAAASSWHHACMTLNNCIAWNNSFTDTEPEYGLSELDGQLWTCGVSESNCLIKVKSSCVQGLSEGDPTYLSTCQWADNIEEDPLLVDGDGPAFDVHLTAGSGCIDSGSTSLWQATDDDGDVDRDSDFTEATPLDLDLRRRDKFGAIAQIVDMGAYEFGCLSDYDGTGFVDGVDLAILLGEWTSASYYAPCPTAVQEDLNGDCKINGLDLAIHLAEWDSCGAGGGAAAAASGPSSDGACGGSYEQFMQWLEADDWDAFQQWYICATGAG